MLNIFGGRAYGSLQREARCPMSLTFRVLFCLLALSLILISPALAQSQSVPNPPASSEINDLAAALVRAASEKDQEQLLARKQEWMNSWVLVARKGLGDPLVRKGDYVEALRISHLAVRIAERIGDRKGLGDALLNLGLIYSRQNRETQAIDSLQKSLAIFEEVGEKK